jgi:hypothetical protein
VEVGMLEDAVTVIISVPVGNTVSLLVIDVWLEVWIGVVVDNGDGDELEYGVELGKAVWVISGVASLERVVEILLWIVVVNVVKVDNVDRNEEDGDSNMVFSAVSSVVGVVEAIVVVIWTVEKVDVVNDPEVWLDVWVTAVVGCVVNNVLTISVIVAVLWEMDVDEPSVAENASVDVLSVIDVDDCGWLVLEPLEVVSITLDSVSVVVSRVK